MGIPKYTSFNSVFLCVVITCFVIHTLIKSRHGRAILSIRENEIAAESCGINTTYYKTMAFVVSAFFAEFPERCLPAIWDSGAWRFRIYEIH